MSLNQLQFADPGQKHHDVGRAHCIGRFSHSRNHFGLVGDIHAHPREVLLGVAFC